MLTQKSDRDPSRSSPRDETCSTRMPAFVGEDSDVSEAPVWSAAHRVGVGVGLVGCGERERKGWGGPGLMDESKKIRVCWQCRRTHKKCDGNRPCCRWYAFSLPSDPFCSPSVSLADRADPAHMSQIRTWSCPLLFTHCGCASSVALKRPLECCDPPNSKPEDDCIPLFSSSNDTLLDGAETVEAFSQLGRGILTELQKVCPPSPVMPMSRR